jgi:hypothetical protein
MLGISLAESVVSGENVVSVCLPRLPCSSCPPQEEHTSSTATKTAANGMPLNATLALCRTHSMHTKYSSEGTGLAQPLSVPTEWRGGPSPAPAGNEDVEECLEGQGTAAGHHRTGRVLPSVILLG